MIKGTIEIDRMQVYARHGVMPQEQQVGNIFEVTVRVEYPLLEAALTDCLTDTLSYADIARVITTEMERPSLLLENVAYRIRQRLVEEFPEITAGSIKVAKPTPPIPAQMNAAAITVEWTK